MRIEPRRSLSVWSLGLCLALVCGHHDAQETEKRDEPPPKVRRPLPAEARSQIAALYERMGQLHGAGRFKEALEPAEEVLAIRTRVQGADYWETVSARWTVKTLTTLANGTPEVRSAYASLAKLRAAALEAMQARRYKEAETLLEQRMRTCRGVLGEKHPRLATIYTDLAVVLGKQGKYSDAQPLFEKAHALRKALLGEEHPLTASSASNLAGNLQHQGKFSEAQPLLDNALALQKVLLGEAHPDTVVSRTNLAGNLEQQGRYAEAQRLLERALAIQERTVGEDRADTATIYNNLGWNLQNQGKYGEARRFLEKATALNKKLFGEVHTATATSYNNLALVLQAQGRYAEAQPLLEQALAVHEKLHGELHPATAKSYGNLALNLRYREKHGSAQPLFERALTLHKKLYGESDAVTGVSYQNLALNLRDRGKYAEAQQLSEKALAIAKEFLGEHPHTASAYSNLATDLQHQGKYADAQQLLEQALGLNIRLFGELHPTTATTYNHLALNLQRQGKLPDAQRLHEKALAISRKVLGEEHGATGGAYNQLARNLHHQGKYEEASTAWARAANIFEKARLHVSFSGLERAMKSAATSPLPLLAGVLARLGKAREAWRRYEESLARGLLDDLSAREARKLTAADRQREHELEKELAKLDALFASLPKQGEARRTTLEGLHQRHLELRAKLTAFKQHLQETYGVAEGKTYALRRIQAQLPEDAALIGWIDIPGMPQAADPGGEHWGVVVRSRGEPKWAKLPPGGGEDASWSEEDDGLGQALAERLAEMGDTNERGLSGLVDRLARQRIAPLEPFLSKADGLPLVRRLIVLPSPALRGVPVALLADSHTVGYASSATVFAWLRERRAARAPANRKSLLAVGDPVFVDATELADPAKGPPEPPGYGLFLAMVQRGSNGDRSGLRSGDVLLSYAGKKLERFEDLVGAIQKTSPSDAVPVTVWRQGKSADLSVAPGRLGVQVDRRSARVAVLAERELAALLRGVRGSGGTFPPLPGTRIEVEAVAGRFRAQKQETLTLLGHDASEERLRELAGNGRLANYRYLHFATHSVPRRDRAFESALILTQAGLPDPLEAVLAGREPVDGRLTAAEVMRGWKLDAELVVLSACQTAIGPHAGGEGYLGFAQAFLLSGARSLVLSLWKVDDTSTALLMSRFYGNLLGRRGVAPLPKAEALREAQRWLRELGRKEAAGIVAKLPVGSRGTVSRLPPRGARLDRPFAHPHYWAAFVLVGDFE